MTKEKEMTAPEASVAADAGQSFNTNCNRSIPESAGKIKMENAHPEYISEEYQSMMRQVDAPGFMPTVTLDQIFGMQFDEKPWIVDGMLRPGLYILAGAPKVGKSFMVAQIAYHVSTGRPLWDRPVHRSPVLYLALEDNLQRFQERMYQMFGVEGSRDLYFSIDAKKSGCGLEAQLQRFIHEHPGTQRIIIDTLKKVRNSDDGTYSYGKDYDELANFQKSATATSICLLIVHHTRKQRDRIDQFNTISGTTGITGAVDGSLLLSKRKRNDAQATLQLTGRDVQDQTFHLVRNSEHLTWELDHVEVEAIKPPPDPVLTAISKLVNELQPEWSGSSTELASLLEVKISPIALTKHLNVNSARLRKEYSIFYAHKNTHSGRRFFLTFTEPTA